MTDARVFHVHEQFIVLHFIEDDVFEFKVLFFIMDYVRDCFETGG